MDIALIVSGGILIGCVIALSWFAGTDAPFVPTKMDQIRKILKLAGVKKGKKFYELGSGDGRVVFEAAKLGANSIGIEQSWLRVLYSRYKAQKLALHPKGVNVSFYHGDIFNPSFWHHRTSLRGASSDVAIFRGRLPRPLGARNDILITDADVIYIYLLSKGVKKLEEKLKEELKKKAVVITQTYHFPNWKPFKKLGDFWFYSQ
ncbi:MAG: hypothetical protein PHV63_03595 [Candidatus Daviesbacteria bacterium]|nr:hypothetical protein [Candidatus Daviesbacteria bacterium]